MTATIDGWHFTECRTLANGDGREIALGKPLRAKGRLTLCKNGMHGSERLIDALQYAPGSILWRVRGSGKIIRGADKWCARERVAVAGGIDVGPQLRSFARDEALRVLHLWPDAPQVVRDYLVTGDNALRAAANNAAYAAARAAAEAVARAAAWAAYAAARAAAEAASWDAAWAARAAAEAVAEAVAEAAARAAAWDAEAAVWAAARAAEAAYRSEQNARLEALMLPLMKETGE